MPANSSITQTPLAVTIGDKRPITTVTIVDATGAPINVSSRTYAAQTRPAPGATPMAVLAVDTSQASTGVLTLSFDGTDSDLVPGVWWWDIVETNGAVVTTIAGGSFTINGRITV